MALKLAGEEIGIQEKIETIIYQPGVKDSGDLETDTKTVTATAKPETADYAASLTIPAPSDSRLTVTRLVLRGNIHIDSFGGSPAATKLYCTVECNGVEKVSAEQLTLAGDDNLFAVDIIADFNIGSANSLEVFLWVDQGQAVISTCQLWLGIGHCGGGPDTSGKCLTINHRGLVTILCGISKIGSGTVTGMICLNEDITWSDIAQKSATYGFRISASALVSPKTYVSTYGSVATDLNYLDNLAVNLRSEQ